MGEKGSLRHSAISGGLWVAIGSSSEQGLRFIRNIILTRILSPESFGAMAIILAISSAFESFTEIGIKEGIIQNPKGKEQGYLNGAWWISAGRSIFLYLAAYIASPFVMEFYNTPNLTGMTRVAFLVVLFNGFMSPNAYVSQKDMKFKRWILIYHGGSVIGILVSIILSFVLKSTWALVIGFSLEAFSRMILSYIIAPFCPNLYFDKDYIRSLLSYSKGMIGLPVMTFIFMRSDVFFVGKICTISELGLYTLVASLARMPFQLVTSMINRIMMPIFSKIQNDTLTVNKYIHNITKNIFLFMVPGILFVIFYADYLLGVVYGKRYSGARVAFGIILITEFLRVSVLPVVTYYFASGRPHLHRNFTIVRVLIILILIYPATRLYGITGAALAGFVATIFGNMIQINQIHTINQLNLKNYYAIFLNALIPTFVFGGLWFASRNILNALPRLDVFSGAIVSIALYIYVVKQHWAESKSIIFFGNKA
jgi:O-antigen/teichoic acid export membrane protein